MANTEKVYSRVTEAEEMVKSLCKKYPDVLWCVRPEMVAVYGIENKERPENCKVLAKIKPVKGVEKAIMQDNNIPIRYTVDLFWSDWREWKEAKRQWIIFHELLHIHSEIGKTIPHDIMDFRVILDQIGVSGYDSEDLPNLLLSDVKFNLALRPSMEDAEETDNIEDDEDNKANKKAKKAKKDKEAKKTEAKEEEPEVKKDDGDVF